jgi:UDP-N-acetylmuramyl pentapeptide phosphotransferase/UDP-N-acetylglucosamine-1-phosphate transferase
MLDVLLTGSVSFFITFLAIPVIIKIADEKKLFDIPDGRKLHKNPIASLGGVGIFAGFFLASIHLPENKSGIPIFHRCRYGGLCFRFKR